VEGSGRFCGSFATYYCARLHWRRIPGSCGYLQRLSHCPRYFGRHQHSPSARFSVEILKDNKPMHYGGIRADYPDHYMDMTYDMGGNIKTLPLLVDIDIRTQSFYPSRCSHCMISMSPLLCKFILVGLQSTERLELQNFVEFKTTLRESKRLTSVVATTFAPHELRSVVLSLSAHS
jgi:hypothetical protein